MKKLTLISLGLIIILSSCKTGNQFTSRRYMKGHYASKMYHKDNIKVLEQQKEMNTVVASANQKTAIDKRHKIIDVENSFIKQKEVLPVSKKKPFLNSIKQTFKVTSTKNNTILVNFEPLLLTKKTQNNSVTSKSATKDGEARFDVMSLLAMIFGILGITMSYVGFMIFAGSWLFTVFFVFALVFGILGLIFGASGIKRYKNNKHWSSLAFGIVGLATGVISIIFGIIYFISNLILILAAA